MNKEYKKVKCNNCDGFGQTPIKDEIGNVQMMETCRVCIGRGYLKQFNNQSDE